MPVHEAMQAAVRADHLEARTQKQMEGVAEDDFGADALQILGGHGLDRAVGAHRHERRRLHAAARELKPAAPRGAVRAEQRETHRGCAHGRGRAAADAVSSMASP